MFSGWLDRWLPEKIGTGCVGRVHHFSFEKGNKKKFIQFVPTD
jgi:hypothetical protein